MNERKFPRAALLAACLGVIAACGGGTDGTGSPVPSAAGITTSGVMTKGSVIVNGVRFDDSAATVTDDRGRTASGLANGMVVKLRGRRIDSGSGIAERIDVENELRAAIASIDPASSPQSFVAAGVTVLVESDDRLRQRGRFRRAEHGRPCRGPWAARRGRQPAGLARRTRGHGCRGPTNCVARHLRSIPAPTPS